MTKNRIFFIAAILVLLTLIFITFLTMDVIVLHKKINGHEAESIRLARLAEYVKFATTLLCVALVLTSSRDRFNDKDYILMGTAFVFTLLADMYLVILPSTPHTTSSPNYYFTAGAGFFIFTQLALILRHSELLKGFSQTGKRLFYVMAVSGIIVYHGSLVFYQLGTAIQQIIAPVIYGLFLMASVAFAWRTRKTKAFPKLNTVLIITGMTLFFCGDASILLSWVAPAVKILVWVFYAPAITLLALSTSQWKRTE